MEVPALAPATTTVTFSIEVLRQALASHSPSVPQSIGPDGITDRDAAVLVPLYRREGSWRVLLCQRSDQVAEHRSEIAFPGGRMEQDDANLVECAVREAWEEVGLKRDVVTVVGSLDPVRTRTGYLVWPTVATVPDSYTFVPSAGEVAALLEVPMAWLLSEESLLHEAMLQPDGTVVRRRTYTFGPHLVYGATAAMLTQLLGFCRSFPEGLHDAISEEAQR